MASPSGRLTPYNTMDLALAQLLVANGFQPERVDYDAQLNRCTFRWEDSDALRALLQEYRAHTATVLFHAAWSAQRTVRDMINAARLRSQTGVVR